jgi:hypothetical protein
MVEEVSLGLPHPPTHGVVEEMASKDKYQCLIAAATAPYVIDDFDSGEVVVNPSAVRRVDDGDVD